MKVAHQSFLRAVGLVPKYLRASETSVGQPNKGSETAARETGACRSASAPRMIGRLKAGALGSRLTQPAASMKRIV